MDSVVERTIRDPQAEALENRRLIALASYDILDTPPEAGFDDLVQLACDICQTPIGLVSLVAGRRQWFKAYVGFANCETDLARSVCSHGLALADLLVIPDLRLDPRTRDNPLVTGDEAIRFYAGAPLRVGSGETLGMLCVIDTVPRPDGLTTREQAGLRALARQVVAALEARRQVVRHDALVEITDRLRGCFTLGELTREAAAIVNRTLAVSRVGYGTIDDTGATIGIVADWVAGDLRSLAATHTFADFGDLEQDLRNGVAEVIADVGVDPRTCANAPALRDLGIAALVNIPMVDNDVTRAIFFVGSSLPRDWTTAEVAFLRNVADRIEVAIARLEADRQQQIINTEISHRLKNLLAMVQAIASQTLRHAADREPIERFERRLMALGTAQDVLMRQTRSSADISDVVSQAIESLAQGERVTISGPRQLLGSRSALSAALVTHELCTNAIKYGALSTPEGHVEVSWAITDGVLTFCWRESGGPAIVAPDRTGFGSKLIKLGLVGTGGSQVSYDAAGFSAVMSANVRDLGRV